MSVTVGVCAYNEGKNIGSLLENILTVQQISSESEILTVCSGCTDDTVEIVKRYAEKDIRVKLILEPERQGKASAINKILTNAKGNSIIFVSADTMPQEECFNKLISTMQNPIVGLACAKPIPVKSSKSAILGEVVQVLWGLHDNVFSQFSSKGRAKHASEIFCIRNKIIDTIPQETVNDDAYIAISIKKKGWKVKYAPDARVSICGPETLQDYIKQRRRVIYGHHQIKKLTGESPQYFLSFLHPHSSAITDLFSSVITQRKVINFIAFISLEVISSFAAAYDSFLRKSHQKWNIASSTKMCLKDPSMPLGSFKRHDINSLLEV